MAERAARITTSFIRAGSKTILVVDDDLSVLGVIKSMLECGGYNVLMAHSAEIALRMVERDELTIDLMLLDVAMPDGAGSDFAERILAIRANPKLLFMSEPSSELLPVKIRNRALGFLPKPFSSDSLLQRVQNALNPLAALRSDDPDSGGTPGEGCAGVTAPLLPRLPRRPPMASKLPLPD